jgi:hypothetical protein
LADPCRAALIVIIRVGAARSYAPRRSGGDAIGASYEPARMTNAATSRWRFATYAAR